jgi:Fe-S cluster assembly protein SufD
MAVAKLKADALSARLDATSVPKGAIWAETVRQDALNRLARSGLPHKKDEYWRYTDPSSLVQVIAPEAAIFHADEVPLFDVVDRLKIVFVDGVFDPVLSDDLKMAGVEIERLETATQKDIHWAKGLYGILEVNGQVPVVRPLAALNTALASDGIVIRVMAKAPRPINLIYLHTDPLADVMLHHVIRLETGAELTLLETGPAAARLSIVTEVDVADGASFHHVRSQGRTHQRRAVTHCFARLGVESLFKSFTLTFNGVLTRNECVIYLTGDNAKAHVAAAAVGDGPAFHHDDTVFITHDAVGCESRQVFKKVLRNGATGVFQGKILVKPGAQKTDGYQISQALLLGEDSQFRAKPELEIYADDVACSHGSTSGAIDDTALFYLRSRGVPEGEATDLLVLAFLAEALSEVEDDRLAEDLRSRLAGWLSRRRP